MTDPSGSDAPTGGAGQRHGTHHDQDNHHSHDHGHDHGERSGDGLAAAQAIRAEALESILVDKGILTPTEVDHFIQTWNHRVGPMFGARVVARAWVDDGFAHRLATDATAAVTEVGVDPGRLEHLEAVFNDDEVHNVVCCTLCSCYPWTVLGLPPAWYKSPEYRSRIVREPRAVLAEMGLVVDPGTRIDVWDSSSEVRYLVIPQRPPGTDGLSEEELAALVTRDSMIGVALAAAPDDPSPAGPVGDPSPAGPAGGPSPAGPVGDRDPDATPGAGT